MRRWIKDLWRFADDKTQTESAALLKRASTTAVLSRIDSLLKAAAASEILPALQYQCRASRLGAGDGARGRCPLALRLCSGNLRLSAVSGMCMLRWRTGTPHSSVRRRRFRGGSLPRWRDTRLAIPSDRWISLSVGDPCRSRYPSRHA